MNEMTTSKSWFQKPEGKVGGVVLILAVIAGLYLFGIMLPTLLILAENTLYLMIMVGAILGILFLIFNDRSRALIWYSYQMIMKTLTGMLIELNPIKILESYIDYLRDSLEEMNNHITSLKREIAKLKGVIQENTKNMEKELRTAQAAEKQGEMDIAALSAKQAKRLENSNVALIELEGKLNNVFDVLIKMQKNSNFLLQDLTNEVDLKKREYVALKAGHSAFKSSMKLFRGDKDKLAIFNEGMEFLVDDTRAKVGEIEEMIRLSSDAMRKIDVNNVAATEEGLELLKKFGENKNVVQESMEAKSTAAKTGKYF